MTARITVQIYGLASAAKPSKRKLEQGADDFEQGGELERAFDCFRIARAPRSERQRKGHFDGRVVRRLWNRSARQISTLIWIPVTNVPITVPSGPILSASGRCSSWSS